MRKVALGHRQSMVGLTEQMCLVVGFSGSERRFRVGCGYPIMACPIITNIEIHFYHSKEQNISSSVGIKHMTKNKRFRFFFLLG